MKKFNLAKFLTWKILILSAIFAPALPGFTHANAEEEKQGTSDQSIPSVSVQAMDGTAFHAFFKGIDGEDLLILRKDEKNPPIDAEPEKLSIRSVRLVDFTSQTAEAEPNSPSEEVQDSPEKEKEFSSLKVTVQESVIHARSLTWKEGKFQIQPAAGGTAAPLDAGMVQEILFKESELGKSKELDADWAEFSSYELESDLLVVLRNGKLNCYFGTILEISGKSVRFEQDGETLKVSRKHIFALRFAPHSNPANETSSSPEAPLLGLLTDRCGSEFHVSKIELRQAFPPSSNPAAVDSPSDVSESTPSATPESANSATPGSVPSATPESANSATPGSVPSATPEPANSADANGTAEIAKSTPSNGPFLAFSTISGLKAELPISELETLNFAEGRTISLASLKPESVEWTPYFSFSAADSPKEGALNSPTEFYQPKINRSFSGEKLRLGGKEYADGMELASRTKIVFRLPASCKKFQTLVGISDFVRPGGNAEISILGDEKILFKETLTGKDEPKSLDLDHTGVRRLTILVDFGKEGSFSDYVVFADAYFLRAN